MPPCQKFHKVFNLFVDWHRTEGRHKKSMGKMKKTKLDKPVLKRTEDLGLPLPRRLLATKIEFREILEEKRIENLEKYLEKSLTTIYSRLIEDKSNQKQKEQLLKKQTKEKKGKKEKKKKGKRGEGTDSVNSKELTHKQYKEWLWKISRPKRIFKPVEQKRARGRVDFARIHRLARPKYRPDYSDQDCFTVSKAALKYNVSDKIKSLSIPRRPRKKFVRQPVTDKKESYPVNPEYKSIKSAGIKNLSLPQQRTEKFVTYDDDEDCPYPRVSPTALQYKPTKYILKLAQPKNHVGNKNDAVTIQEKALRKLADRWHYERVSRAALKHEPSEKTLKLSKPKEREEVKENEIGKVNKKALAKLQPKKLKIFNALATPLERKMTPKYEIPKHTIS